MPDLPPHPDASVERGMGTARRLPPSTPPGAPRWVKVSGVAVIVLVLLFVILHLTGNSPVGMHGHAPLIQYWVQQP